ncbi:MAG TPA: hypothetical protein VHL59_19000 [Thermoanaerobaculia bacterium]|nr:hypothetical protein [Thermoanaerobaculia bacterium]
MLKKLKAKVRRRKVKKIIRNHASEIIVGVAMGLLTDILTDIAHAKLKKKARRL